MGSNFFYLYLLLINSAAGIAFGIDKWKAVHHRWRIRESILLGFAVLGGSVGALIGMYLFRHKTKKPKFTVGIPVLLAVQVFAAVVIRWKWL